MLQKINILQMTCWLMLKDRTFPLRKSNLMWVAQHKKLWLTLLWLKKRKSIVSFISYLLHEEVITADQECAGAVASWLVCSSPEWAVRVWALAGRHCVVFLGKTLNSHSALSTQEYKWVPANCWGKPNKLRGNDLWWTSILSRGSRNTPSYFMLQKPGISASGSYDPVGPKASFIYSRLHFYVLTMWAYRFLGLYTVIVEM